MSDQSAASDSSLSIGIVCGFFLPVPPERGGAMEKIMLALAGRFADSGHRVCLYSRRWPGFPDEESRGDIRHRRIPGANHSGHLLVNLLLDGLWALRVISCLEKHDVIISNSVFFPVLYKFLRPGGAAVFAWIARMPKGQLRLYQSVDRLIAPARVVVDRITAEAPALKDKVLLIPNPMDWSMLNATPRQICDDTVRISYAGRLHPEKGLPLLLEAASLLASMDLPQWRLTLVGPITIADGGGGEDYLQELRETFGPALGARWQTLPPIYRQADLNHFYASTDIFCYPSIAEQGETLGVAAIEAMAAGAVPVVSALSCFEDFIQDGFNGRVFNHRSENASSSLATILAALIQDVGERNRLALAARQTARQFDYDVVASRLLTEFASLRK